MLESACVVIPIYNPTPSEFEKLSLNQCFDVLGEFPLAFVCPKTFDRSVYITQSARASCVSFESFDDGYFADGTAGYNKLMLSHGFYERFREYQYILIYQTDAFVFTNTLTQWCKKKQDYIGAPWLDVERFEHSFKEIQKFIVRREKNALRKRFMRFRWALAGLNNSEKTRVGNGGFSLRNVTKCLEAIDKFHVYAREWKYNEDYFWSIFLPLMFHTFRIPSFQEALSFSFDIHPEKCFNLNGKKLPFGCHAWYRTDKPYENNLHFWKGVIGSHSIRLPE
jgi:hypothetical protein